MNIIIAGAGRIGRSLARQLSAEGHDLTVIDTNEEKLAMTGEKYDVITVRGNCATMTTLRKAGIESADVLIASARADETNLLCCMTGHALNPNLHTIARIRTPDYYDQIYEMRESFHLSMTFNPELTSAREITRLLEYPAFLQRETFDKDRVEIVELPIKAGSKLDGVRLTELHSITGCQVLVCTVIRDGKTIMPDGSFTLQGGDRIYVTASSEELTTLLRNLGIIQRRICRVLICGGGRISFYLTKLLSRAGIHVRILERDEARCEHLADILPEAEIILGDASDRSVLEEQAASECDAVVSLTGLDEVNMIISLYASDLGVPHVLTKVGRLESFPIVDKLGVGSAVCPQEVVGGSIVRYIRAVKNLTGAALSVHSIANGNAEAQEFEVDETTKNRGIPLKDISLRPNVLLVSISHHGKATIPNGSSSFDIGDTLVVVTDSDNLTEQLNDIFLP